MKNINYILSILSIFCILNIQAQNIQISRSVIGSYGGSHSVTINGINCVIMDNVGEVAVITAYASDSSIILTQGFEQENYSLIPVIHEEIPLPNAFSPDGNFTNDQWPYPIRDDKDEPIDEIIIFNRWGDIIFKSIGVNNNWNGTNIDGEEVPSGTYFYIVKFSKDGSSQSSWVQLVR